MLVVTSFAIAPAAAVEEILIEVGDDWDYFKGTEEAPLDWNTLEFEPQDWLVGPTGIGYSDGDDATVLTDMQNNYASIFCRRLFDVADVASVETLALRIDYDDGFVAYLNGEEVARSPNMGLAGDPVTAGTLASGDHEAGTVEEFLLDPGELTAGENVLAIEVHQTSLGSSDLSFIPQLVANPDLCPRALACTFDLAADSVTLSWTNQTLYDEIEVRRDGKTLEAGLDGALQTYFDPQPPEGLLTYEVLATDGGEECPALSCTVRVFTRDDVLIDVGEEWRFLRGSGVLPIDWAQPNFDDETWELGPTGIGYGDGDDATVLGDMQNNYLAVFCRRDFELPDLNGVQGLFLSLIYDDGAVVYMNGEEIGRVNMPVGVADEFTTATAAIEPTLVELPIDADVLQEGTNVLAVSVHNANFTSSDLSFIPMLVRLGGTPPARHFRRGDASNDRFVNLTDAVSILNHLFRGMPITACLDAGDVDDDGRILLTDPVALLGNLFRSGAEPPPPGRVNCGPDPTPDALGECSSAGC